MANDGSIPSSTALDEADPMESIQELFARDPESFQQQDKHRIIEAMQQLRERLAVASPSVRPRATRVAGPPARPDPSADPSKIGF